MASEQKTASVLVQRHGTTFADDAGIKLADEVLHKYGGDLCRLHDEASHPRRSTR